MNDAWNVIYLALNGVLELFRRVFVAFSLQDIVLPLVVIGSVFTFLIVPIVGRINILRTNNERKKARRDKEKRRKRSE